MLEDKMYKKEPHKRFVGFQISRTQRCFKRVIEKKVNEQGFGHEVAKYAWFIGYIHQRNNEHIYQKTLENAFNMPRSSITKMVQELEKSELITRETVEGDARLKEVVLTEKGNSFIEEHLEMLDEIEDSIRQCMTKEEAETLFRLLEKIDCVLETEAGK
ncbi:MAG: MarR family transcriptional regulator [Fermentimonas sp.]|jgi:DNA-binding MarR family transcriptional regulator|nr:MarR family transcriptional regulator [Fermentimonas sp.]